MIDGVFAVGEDGQGQFADTAALTPTDRVAVQQQVRARVLCWFARAGTLAPADARDMAHWHHGERASLDAAVFLATSQDLKGRLNIGGALLGIMLLNRIVMLETKRMLLVLSVVMPTAGRRDAAESEIRAWRNHDGPV